MFDPEDVVLAVCRLAVDYQTFGTLSAVDLVRRSGYLTEPAAVTVDGLSMCLAEHPDWVTSWFRWSEDTRGSPAWYIRECRPDLFEVGYSDGGYHRPFTFDDKVRACAEYLHRTIESIAGHEVDTYEPPFAPDTAGG